MAGEALHADLHQNNLWCRRDPGDPWVLDVLVGDGDDDAWVFRRDAAVRRPWTETILYSESSVPYLAPEIQLLFKSGTPRPKDDADAAVMIPLLTQTERQWLDDHLPAGHEWRRIISDADDD